MYLEFNPKKINSEAGKLFNHYWYNSDPSGSITGEPFFGKVGWGFNGIDKLLGHLLRIARKGGFTIGFMP